MTRLDPAGALLLCLVTRPQGECGAFRWLAHLFHTRRTRCVRPRSRRTSMRVGRTVQKSKGRRPRSSSFPWTLQWKWNYQEERPRNNKSQSTDVWSAMRLCHGGLFFFVFFLFEHLLFGRLIDASILPLAICRPCSMLIEWIIDGDLPYQTDLYHIYLPHQKHVCTSQIAARVNSPPL